MHIIIYNLTEFRGWWDMQKPVENRYLKQVDPTDKKVEELRKYTRELFAVVHFRPEQWGNNSKREFS